jgi:hypothetical protein
LLERHFPECKNIVIRSTAGAALKNASSMVMTSGVKTTSIEMEVQDAADYTKIGRMKKRDRQEVTLLSLRESPRYMPWMVSKGHELGRILHAYRGIRHLALDFGLTCSSLEFGSQGVFAPLNGDILPDLTSLTLRFEAFLQPLPEPQEPFMRKQVLQLDKYLI